MNKRGFTLIEVIGVITVLSIILIVAVPSLTRTLKRNEQNKYNDFIDNLKIASENYVVKLLKSGEVVNETIYMTLGDLIDSGYINETVANPEYNKTLSRDTRIKAYKEVDGTYSYDIHECYNTTEDYDKEDLIVHYDSIQYSPNNVMKNLTGETDFDYSRGGAWTEEGVLFSKGENSMPTIRLNNEYLTEQLTLSINLESLDEIVESNYQYFTVLDYNNNYNNPVLFAFKKSVALFYWSGDQTVFSNYQKPLTKEKNYTLTYVQENLSTRKLYVNGELWHDAKNLNLTPINYNGFKFNPQTMTNVYDLNVHNLLIYNRGLTADEVKELYELDKERFGE